MGYIVALVLLVAIVPLLFVLLSRRTSGAGTATAKRGGRGITVEQPSSDQATPGADTLNQPSPGAERRIPPG